MHFRVDLMTFSVIKLLKNNHHKKTTRKPTTTTTIVTQNVANIFTLIACCFYYSHSTHTERNKKQTENPIMQWKRINALHAATTYLFTWHRQNRVDIMTMELGAERESEKKYQTKPSTMLSVSGHIAWRFKHKINASFAKRTKHKLLNYNYKLESVAFNWLQSQLMLLQNIKL